MNTHRVVTLALLLILAGLLCVPPVSRADEDETFVRDISAALSQLARDIRGAHYRIDVQNGDDSVTLVLHQFLVDETSGIPKVGRKGYPKEGYPIKYIFSRNDRLLYREHLEGRQVICRHFLDVDFEIKAFEIGSSERRLRYRVPAVRATFVLEEEGEQVSLDRLIVPRFTAAWARQPTWVINSQGACLRFPIFVSKR